MTCSEIVDEATRWQKASFRAGNLLGTWYRKHPIILNAIAPRLGDIIYALKSQNIDIVEKLLDGEKV
jgi:hypothetical protein